MTTSPDTITPPDTHYASPMLASAVMTATIRLAGPVPTGITPQFLGQPEQLVVARIGDVLLYLTEPRIAHRIRVHWDAQLLHARRLPEQVSQTWLAPRPGTYPIALSLQLTWPVDVHARWMPADLPRREPAHLQIRIDRLIWQICDQEAWAAVGNALFNAQQYLPTDPTQARSA